MQFYPNYLITMTTHIAVNDGMKGGTPDILYDLCLGLDKQYSESIDGLPEPTCHKLYSLFIERWNVFHTPVHSVYFIMDKAFCHIQHDDESYVEHRRVDTQRSQEHIYMYI
jgi:hypothetical protein